MSHSKEKADLEAINIIKGLCFAQLTTEDMRNKLVSSPEFDVQDIFNRIDRKGQRKLSSADLSEFLSVHRIAASDRQCQYLINLSGNIQAHMSLDAFTRYMYCGSPDQRMSGTSRRSRQAPTGDVLVKNFSERETAKILEKELEFYRSLETLKEDYVAQYGYNLQSLYEQLSNKGVIEQTSLGAFILHYRDRVDFTKEEYLALCRRVSDNNNRIMYQQFTRAFSPFEPVNFPIFRKQHNLKDALDFVWSQVRKLNIDTRDSQNAPQNTANRTGFAKTNVSFRRVYDPYKNPQATAGYFYDRDYFNQLKDYKVTYFDPNRDYKFIYEQDSKGPQYHDHFFSDYYRYLHERNKSQYYYNKFGKRYTYENPMQLTRKDSRRKL